MIGDSHRSQMFIKAFFSELCRKNIRYCILHNLEEVASGASHDIDMCIESEKLAEAELTLHHIAKTLDWKMHLQTGSIKDSFNAKSYHYHYIDTANQNITLIHFDFVPVTAWKGREIVSNETLLSGIEHSGLFRASSPEVMAVVDLFPHLLYDGYIKDNYKERIHQAFTSIPHKILPIVCQFLPRELAEKIINLTQEHRWQDILELRPLVARHALLRAPRRRWAHFCHIIRKLTNPAGIMVAFMGVDGSGKSTVINELPKILGNSFTGDTFDYYHWRPGFLKSEKKTTSDGLPITDTRPHQHAPSGRIKSFLKLGFYTLDYIFGYWFRVRKQTAQGHLIVFDRYFYDFYVDRQRYRLTTNDWIVRLFQLFIPSPDITFLLIGDAIKIHARKDELSIEEIRAQIARLLHHQHRIANPVIVDSGQSIPTVRYEVCKEILRKLHQINARHPGG